MRPSRSVSIVPMVSGRWGRGIGASNQGGIMTGLEPVLPGDYAAALTILKGLVRQAQQRAQRVVNTAMIEL